MIVKRILKAGVQKIARCYVSLGYPLLPVTRLIREPLRWFYHRSPLLRHDSRRYFKPHLLTLLHHWFIQEHPNDFRFFQNQIKFRSFGSDMSLHAYYVGEVEYHMLQFLLKQLVPNFVMLDVGAHHGVFTLVAARELKNRQWSGVIHSFEPNPQNFALLEHNVRENGFQAFTVLHQEAVGDIEGQSILRINPLENSDNVLADEEGVRVGGSDVTVNVIRLDSLLAHLPRVNVLKIDVQGREPAVLNGAKKLIARDRPVIIVEAVAEWPSTRQIEFFLKEHKYAIYGVDPKGELCRPNSQEAYVSWDWVGVPE